MSSLDNIKQKLKNNKILKNIYPAMEGWQYKLATVISPELNTRMSYKAKFGKEPDLKNPKTFNEKILWLKLHRYMHDPLIIQCADKVAVRDYIKSCGCEEILNDVIGIYDKAEDIPWEELPNRFVLKWNFGAGMNIICSDKSKLDRQEVISQMDRWGKCKYWLPHSELQYKYIRPQIICERFLDDGSGTQPKDYKVYCFNGVAKFVMVCLERETKNTKFFYFDRQWNMLPYSQDSLNDPNYIVEKPECLEQLFEYAAKLCSPFPFVRADFYVCQSKIYFGELTFTPSAGLDNDNPAHIDRLFGDMLNLSKVNF